MEDGLLLSLLSLTLAKECTGDVEIVLVDPVATERARDQLSDAVLKGAELFGALGTVAKFALSTGLNSDGWLHSQAAISDWMATNGVEGSVELGRLSARDHWYRLAPDRQTWVEETLIQPGLPRFYGFFPQDTAIFVRIANPRQAIRAATGRGLGWFPPSPRLKAQAAVVQAMVPSMVANHLDAFVSFGEGACQ